MRLRVETGVTLIVRCCLSVFLTTYKLSHAIDCPIPSLMSQEYSLFYRAEGVMRRTPRFPLTIAIAYVSPDKIYG